jgi:membrane associated rhomboid family serine protease
MRVRYSGYNNFQLNPVWIIILLNLAVFVVTYILIRTISFDAYIGFIYQFGLPGDGFLERPWTIVTSMFIHSGWGHIIANMLTLYFFGSYLSRLIGDKKFLVVYFGGGILGGILFTLLASPFSVAVGASGAVYAVAGALAMLRPNLRVLLYFIVPMPLWVVVLVFFVIFSFLPFVAWQAHLGGLALGLVAGYFFRKRERYSFY